MLKHRSKSQSKSSPSHSPSLQVPYRLAEPNLNLDFREIITMAVIVWPSLGDTPAACHDSRVGFSSEIRRSGHPWCQVTSRFFFKAKDGPKVTITVTITAGHSWQSCPDLQVLDQLMPVITECSKNTLLFDSNFKTWLRLVKSIRSLEKVKIPTTATKKRSNFHVVLSLGQHYCHVTVTVFGHGFDHDWPVWPKRETILQWMVLNVVSNPLIAIYMDFTIALNLLLTV